MKAFLLMAPAVLLAACGGGGGSSAPAQTASADITQPALAGAQAAADKATASLPAAKPFTGGFASVDGYSQGFVLGTSERDIAEKLGRAVAASPSIYGDFYKALLSDAGMRVVVFGASIGKSSINGAILYAADSVFIVKLTTNGVVVTGG